MHIFKKSFIVILLLINNTYAISHQETLLSKRKICQNFIESGWNFKIGESLRSIHKNLGQPISQLNKEVQSPYYSARDLQITLTYRGLELHVVELKSTENKGMLITKLKVSTNQWPLKYGIKIGMLKNKIIKILGPDFKGVNQNSIQYFGDETDVLELEFDKDILKNITWYFYTG